MKLLDLLKPAVLLSLFFTSETYGNEDNMLCDALFGKNCGSAAPCLRDASLEAILNLAENNQFDSDNMVEKVDQVCGDALRTRAKELTDVFIKQLRKTLQGQNVRLNIDLYNIKEIDQILGNIWKQTTYNAFELVLALKAKHSDEVILQVVEDFNILKLSLMSVHRARRDLSLAVDAKKVLDEALSANPDNLSQPIGKLFDGYLADLKGFVQELKVEPLQNKSIIYSHQVKPRANYFDSSLMDVNDVIFKQNNSTRITM